MKRKVIAVVMAAVALVGLSACKEVDKKAVGAQLVHGTNNLYWFCDANNTLIYFEDISGGDDEYIGMWVGACAEGKPVKDFDGSNSTNGGSTEGE
jgi:hypothetical protein